MDFLHDEDQLREMEEDLLCSIDARDGKLHLFFPDSSQIWIERKQEKLFWISGTTQIIQTMKNTVVVPEIAEQNCIIWHGSISSLFELIREIKSVPWPQDTPFHPNTDAVEKNRRDLEDYWREISKLDKTEQESRMRSRVGQDKLRKFMISQLGGCVITGICLPQLLIASHIKPWRNCCDNRDECLDPENILLLARNYDAFFDAGLISFSPEDGSLISSPSVSKDTYVKMGIDPSAHIPRPSPRRQQYLRFHNQYVMKT